MRAYLIRRFLQTLVVLFTVVTIVFVLFRLLPGDPTSMLVDQSLDEMARQRLLVEWGLNKPLFDQYLIFLANIASFNFGCRSTIRRLYGRRSIRRGGTRWC